MITFKKKKKQKPSYPNPPSLETEGDRVTYVCSLPYALATGCASRPVAEVPILLSQVHLTD